MLFSLLVPSFLALSSTLAAPPALSRKACEVVQAGNLSPNGVSGNFRLVNGVLAFDPTNLATGFDISLQSCGTTANAAEATSPGHLIADTTGQCLAVTNATATQGPSVVGVDCATATNQAVMNWVMSQGFLFWTGETTLTCGSGLYGYQAVSSSGTPAAVQKAPISLGCSTASNVFGFSVLE